jgi:D-serine dehydratase
VHKFGDDVRYLYAEPQHCVCIFVGTRQNFQDYRDILSQPLVQADDVSPDYKTQADALLYGDPYDFDSLNDANSLAEYFRDYY